MYSSQKFIQAS